MLIVYSKPGCVNCVKAKQFLADLGVTEFEYITLHPEDEGYPTQRDQLLSKSGNQRTFPFIFVNGTFIGGYNELVVAANTGKLEELGVQINNDF